MVSFFLIKAKCNMYPATAAQSPLAVAESRGGADSGILNLTLLQSSLPPVYMWVDTRDLGVVDLRR